MTDTQKLIRALRCTGKVNCDMNCNVCAFHQTKHNIMSLDLLATDDLLKLADLINLAADKIEELSSGKGGGT